ncbi:MAG: hypothetical protein ACE5HO_18400 [bacterium]
MNANDVEIARVYTRAPGGIIADTTFASNEKCEIVVEAEAGSAVFDTGGPYIIGIAVHDLTDSKVEIHNFEEQSNYQAPGTWVNQSYQKVFGPFSLQDVSGFTAIQGLHCFEVLAYVRSGKKNPDVSFAKSPVFVYFEGTR